MNQKMQEEPKWKRTWHFIRPTVISVAVVLLAFFIMQGRPLATTLDRRTDLVSVVVTQNGGRAGFYGSGQYRTCGGSGRCPFETV